VWKVEIYGLRVTEDVNSETNLPKLIVKEAEGQAYGIREGDVVVITSKIVSKVEGGVHKLSEVKPSRRAYLLSRFYKTPPEVMELYLRAGEIRAVIPIEKLAKKYGHLFEEYARNKEDAHKAIREHPYIFLVRVGNRLLTWGGIDFSNSPPGYCTSIPQDPDESARRIREEIRKLTGKETAVVITDTEGKLDKFGTIDIAIGSSGIQPISRNFGAKDLYGTPKFGGIDDLTNLVSASASLLFGQTDEAIPIAIIRGLKYEKSEKGIKGLNYLRKTYRGALGILAWENIKFKLLSKLI
jgi:coenzyme F420-0:L-glutamate ligase/coenzyme F420-1:gamma-L-glutamate ligase